MAEVLPAQQLPVRVFRKQPFEGLAAAHGHAFVVGFLNVEQTREHQEGDLFDDGQGVGNAAGPKFFPELVDLIA
jgi:hypothetical protein